MSQGSTPSHPVLEVGQRLVTEVLAPMKEAFVAKDEIIDLMGICLVGGENLFLLGPPGTAKSALVLELGRRLEGYTFSYLLTRFTEPNEIFGPFDIRKLREGELETNTEGMLPEASLVFLDELLNANSAILNSLLTVLNERVFRRGRETRALPMRMAVGASNHLPEDESLRALFDRFLLRVHCDQVPEERLPEVLHAGWALEREQEHPPRSVSMDELAALSAELPRVDLSEVHEPFVKLVLHLRNAGIELSDRRAVKLQRLVAASALLCGRTQAIPLGPLGLPAHLGRTRTRRSHPRHRRSRHRERRAAPRRRRLQHEPRRPQPPTCPQGLGPRPREDRPRPRGPRGSRPRRELSRGRHAAAQ
jgi:MoxR-like ATPase